MPTTPSAKVLLDSISPQGDRLTTLEVVMHRFVLAEFNTHRMFTRSSASSRAISIIRRIRMVLTDLAWPVEWGKDQPKMQSKELLPPWKQFLCVIIWKIASLCAVACAYLLNLIGLHKQWTNRLLEPFMWHTVIVASVEWENFYKQRCSKFSPLAQPEMLRVADAIHNAIEASTPRLCNYGQWHAPLLRPEDLPELHDVANGNGTETVRGGIKVSIARCARSSYLTHAGIREILEDLKLFGRLETADPPHWAPFEHAATPAMPGEKPLGNFPGWHQYRHYQQVDLSGSLR